MIVKTVLSKLMTLKPIRHRNIHSGTRSISYCPHYFNDNNASRPIASIPLTNSPIAKLISGSSPSSSIDSPYQLCFLRHGQSTWNRDNRFIGWTDTPLTEDGVEEARVAGQMLSYSGMKFDEVHTSLLRRSIRTTDIVLMETGQEYVPVHKHWRLNERHYGNLVGQNKKEAVKIHGADQVKKWRRSWDEPPPSMAYDHEFHPAQDPRYQDVSATELILCSFPSYDPFHVFFVVIVVFIFLT